MKKLMYLLMATLIISCQSNESDNLPGWDENGENWQDRNTYSEPEPEPQLSEAELHKQLENKECQNPVNYLDGTVSYKPIFKNVFSTKVKGLKLRFDFFSQATLATYKDIRVGAELQSKTGSVIKREELIVYEYLSPNGSVTYRYDMSITNQQYKDLYEINWYINEAECVN